MYGMDPGRRDLVLAEFQAKLAAGTPQYPDPAEERMVRMNRLVIGWAVLVTLVAGVLTWFFDAEVAVIGSIALTLAALLLAWLSRRRNQAQVASLNDQP